MRPKSMRPPIALAVWTSVVAFAQPIPAQEQKEQLELLRQNGVGTETAELVKYLHRLQPSDELQAEIAETLAGLSDAKFTKREAAFKKLISYGEAARRLLSAAAKSDDPELGYRAQKLLAALDSGEQAKLRQSLNVASLGVLRARRDPQAAPVILATLELLTEPYTRDLAAQALWACAEGAPVELIAGALGHKDLAVQAAAVVAAEVAGGDKLTARIEPLLGSEQAAIRLAAARALIDRKPNQAVEALVELAAEKEGQLSWQADALLQMKTGHTVRLNEDQTLGDAWREWSKADLATADLSKPLGDRRLDLSAGRNTLEEDFSRKLVSLDRGYGRFEYEADNSGPAKVADGKLRIDGDNAEGDQRFFITSERMIGSERWPDRLEVKVKLAGEAGNNFGYHVGVSVGRVKTLFHPGLRGGGFRAETTDDHDYIFNNEQMSFNPGAGVMYEMLIRVTKTRGGAEFDVTVTGGEGDKPHKREYSVTNEELGDFNRIGLERSGRTGGDAVFDSLSIRLGH